MHGSHPPLPADIAADLNNPDVTVTATDPKSPSLQHHGPNPSPGWWHPGTWLVWLRNAVGEIPWHLRRLARLGRHQHFYQLIGVSHASPSLAHAVAGMPASTVLAFRCYCHAGSDQLRFSVVPGRWEVDDLVTADMPVLTSVRRQRDEDAITIDLVD